MATGHVMSYRLQGFTKPALRRLVKRVDNRCRISSIEGKLFGWTKVWLEEVLQIAIIFMNKSRKSMSTPQPNRIRVAHILAALRHAPGKNAKKA